MDSSRKALQTNGKLFLNFEFVFELNTIFKIIVALGLVYAYEVGEAFVLISTCSSSILITFFLFYKKFITYVAKLLHI